MKEIPISCIGNIDFLLTSVTIREFLIIFSSFVSTAAHEWERFSIKSGTNGLGVYKSPGPFIGTVARE